MFEDDAPQASPAKSRLLAALRFPPEKRGVPGLCCFSSGPDLLGDFYRLEVHNLSNGVSVEMIQKRDGEKWTPVWTFSVDEKDNGLRLAKSVYSSGPPPKTIEAAKELARAAIEQIGPDSRRWRAILLDSVSESRSAPSPR